VVGYASTTVYYASEKIQTKMAYYVMRNLIKWKTMMPQKIKRDKKYDDWENENENLILRKDIDEIDL
jgi:hypothetical protein